jgi:hypothetical protein
LIPAARFACRCGWSIRKPAKSWKIHARPAKSALVENALIAGIAVHAVMEIVVVAVAAIVAVVAIAARAVNGLKAAKVGAIQNLPPHSSNATTRTNPGSSPG